MAHKKTHKIRRRSLPGTAPGIIDPQVQSGSGQAGVVLQYNRDSYQEQTLEGLKNLKRLPHHTIWIHFDEIPSAKTLFSLGELFGLHRLALEDVTNTYQLPKIDEYKDHSYVVMRTLRSTSEQLSIFIGQDWLITIHESAGESFRQVRERIQQKIGRIRERGVDYLFYALIDATIDEYFPILEKFADQLEEMEEGTLINLQPTELREIHSFGAEIDHIKRIIWKHRDLVHRILRDPPTHFNDETSVYIRDCLDHLNQQIELSDTYRDSTRSLMELSVAVATHRQNEVMKVLTIVASIFIPLTFITSLYGMNFNHDISPWNMPELNWRYGYPLTLAAMLLISVLLMWFFWKKRWIGRS